jgi:hypothetical protein
MAGLLYSATLIAAGNLGILWTFHDAAGREITGFGNSHWGPLFLFAMPLAAFLIGLYLRVLENTLQSVDEVVVPVSQATAQPFSGFISGRLRYAWMSWMFPLAVAAPILLTIVADGRDIIAPLQSRVIAPSNEIDWSTLGYSAHPEKSALSYLLFNLLAWSMQIFLGYCGFLVLLITTFLLGIVFRYGLGGRSITKIIMPPSAEPPPEKYQPRWDCTKRRCGLEDLDLLFGFFVALIIAVLLICSVSILANAFLKNGPDIGSAILIFCAVFLLPAAVFWVFQPYFTNFPKELPATLKGKPGYVEPSPWPFGNEKLAWGIIVTAWGLWAFLVWTVIKLVFRGIAD